MHSENLALFANILLIAGAGRNTGKTTLACKLIEHFSAEHKVTGIKISPHFHESEKDQKIIIQKLELPESDEMLNNNKDSSKMLKAGAQRVFYIQTKQENLKEVFDYIIPDIKNGPVICESGGLNQIIRPGIFLFTHKNMEIPENKQDLLKYDPILIDVFHDVKTFNINKLLFTENMFLYRRDSN